MTARVRPPGARGFSLIEIMVLVSIIAILAAIATPMYLNHRKKAVTVEASMGLRTIWELENTHLKEYDRYSADLTAIGFRMEGTSRHTYSVQADDRDFTARAVANIDLDEWEIRASAIQAAHVATD